MDEIRNITSETSAAVMSALHEAIATAYKRGYDAGRQEGHQAGERDAAARFKSRLDALFVDDAAQSSQERAPVKEYAPVNDLITVPAESVDDRAAPGTVKPVILAAVANSNVGMTTRQIQEQTYVKYNSVRGTLWQLQKEGAVERDLSGRWVATPPVKEAAKKQALDKYLDEIKLAEAKNSEAPAGEPESASTVAGDEVPASSPNMGSGND